jgi:hypothetical protein
MGKNREPVWKDEPDELFYYLHDEIPCLVRRNPHIGNLCGYCAVPPQSSLHGASLDTMIPMTKVIKEWVVSLDELGIRNVVFSKGDDEQRELRCLVRCHHGLTFTGYFVDWEFRCGIPEKFENWWWFGFDCGHLGDYCPGSAAVFEQCGLDYHNKESEYRDIEFVKNNIAKMWHDIAYIEGVLDVCGQR